MCINRQLFSLNIGFYPHIRNLIKVFRMDQKDQDWEEEFPELSEPVEQTHEDFKLSGAGNMYELRPMSTKAFVWVSQNLKFEIWDIPPVICLKKDEMEKMVTTILEDGLNFSLTCH